MTFPQKIDLLYSAKNAIQLNYNFVAWTLAALALCFLIPLIISTYKMKPSHPKKAQYGTDQADQSLKTNVSESESDNVILLDADLPLGMDFRSKLQSRGLNVHFGPNDLDKN